MEYLYVIIFFVVLFTFAYIKVGYPFWNIQPVYHYYDIYVPLLREPYVVYKHYPIITKFCDFANVKTFSFLELSEEQSAVLTNLIQCYTIPNEKILYIINEENLRTYLTGQTRPSWVSFYKDFEYRELTDPSGNANVHIDSQLSKMITEYKGCITSRYIRLYYQDTEWEAYYIDYLAVHRSYNDATINRKLLQTHEYLCQVLQPQIKISILRKEIHLYEGVVPLVEFSTAVYDLNTMFPQNTRLPKLPPHFTVQRIFKENLEILTNFFHKMENKTTPFTLSLISELGNIMALIKRELLYVYCLKRREQVYAIYFIKDERIQYDEFVDAGTLNAIASYHNSQYPKLFALGFVHAMKIIKRFKGGFNTLLMDNIGHNLLISDLWKKRYTPIIENKTAYYSYNFVVPRSPILKETAFVLL
jgi:hypothetical protein